MNFNSWLRISGHALTYKVDRFHNLLSINLNKVKTKVLQRSLRHGIREYGAR